MLRQVVLVTALLFSSAAAFAHSAQTPVVKSYDSLAPILARILHARPRVIAFGEYHQTKDGPKAPSAISRFTGQMLDAFKSGASDLVVETWITKGDCGATEKKVVKQVETTTQRPEATEDEVVTLIKRAKTDGLQPHILELSCDEYRAIEPKDGEVDYEKLLGVITEKLRRAIIFALAMQAGGPPRTVLVYGGALHNDLHPEAALAAYSFGPAIDRAVHRRYLEVDLYVPEYIEGDREITSQPWYARYLAAARPGRPTLVERGPRSYIIVFPRQAPPPSSPPSPPDAGAE
jgi:hypothetical protein